MTPNHLNHIPLNILKTYLNPDAKGKLMTLSKRYRTAFEHNENVQKHRSAKIIGKAFKKRNLIGSIQNVKLIPENYKNLTLKQLMIYLYSATKEAKIFRLQLASTIANQYWNENRINNVNRAGKTLGNLRRRAKQYIEHPSTRAKIISEVIYLINKKRTKKISFYEAFTDALSKTVIGYSGESVIFDWNYNSNYEEANYFAHHMLTYDMNIERQLQNAKNTKAEHVKINKLVMFWDRVRQLQLIGNGWL
jgi:hypothetical protein